MTITRMPDGSYVDIGPNATPQQIAEIRARHTPRAAVPARPAATRPAAPAQPSGNARARAIAGAMGLGIRAVSPTPGYAAGVRSLAHEATFHLDDVASSAVMAAASPDVWRGRRRFGDEYRTMREANRLLRNDEGQNDPVSTGVGGLGGMVLGSPGRLAAGVGERVAPRLTENIASRLASRPIRSAALEGATAAGITSLADTDGDLGQAATAAAGGAAFGGAAGAIVGRVAPGIARAFSDRNPAEAERVAYDKIAAVLGRGRDEAGNVLTPRAASAEIADATARGTPTQLGDLTPELSSTRSHLVRRTELPSSGDAVVQAEQRLATAADRFDDFLRTRIRPATGQNAIEARTRITTQRKAQAAKDYAKGGAMDKPLARTPALIQALTKPTPDMRDALKAAQRAFLNDPSMGKFAPNAPTTRVFDEIKKAFDDIIEGGIKHLPDGSTVVSNASRAASNQIRALKNLVAESNPEYAALVGRQRDAFERIESLKVGNAFIERIRKFPREVLADLTAREARNPEEVRTGIIDALLSMRNQKASPIKLLRSWERHPDQRAVLEHIMGGNKAFNEFSKFMRRELRAMQADADILRKANSPLINEFVEHGEDAGKKFNGMAVLRGQAYGGVMGGVSATMRELDQLRRGMGPEAQEQTLRLLNGNGEGLEAGINSAKAVRDARRAAAAERARLAGRVAGRGSAALVGTGE